MTSLGGKLEEVRAARLRIPVGDAELDRTFGGSGEPGTTARTKAGDRGGVAQGQGGTPQAGAGCGERPHPAPGIGGPGAEGAATRAPVGVRDRHGERGTREGIAPWARGRGATAAAGTYAAGPAGALYRPSCSARPL